MRRNQLFLIENEKVLDFAFENQRDFCQCQCRCVDFSTLDVSDLVVANTGFNSELILRYAVAHPQLTQPFTQPAFKPILLFWGHSSKLPLSAVPDRPIYRVILFLFLSFGMETIVALGWDVGGYKGGNNAFALATVSGSETKLRICTGELELCDKDGLYKFPGNLFSSGDNFVIAVDAPFGFPSSLLDFINDEDDTGSYFERDIENVYVFRETDREVKSVTKKKPLSPVFDKLGRNTFRAIRQLRKWKQDRRDLMVLPWDGEPDGTLNAIEVYPGVLAGTPSFYKQFKNRYEAVLSNVTGLDALAHNTFFSSFEEIYGSSVRIKKKGIRYNDEVDAAICALMGVEFAKNKSPLSHIPSLSKREGWIYIPSFLNSNNLT